MVNEIDFATGLVRVHVGAHTQEDRSTDEVGRFLSMLRFESRGNLEELVTERDKTTKNRVVSGSSLCGGNLKRLGKIEKITQLLSKMLV